MIRTLVAVAFHLAAVAGASASEPVAAPWYKFQCKECEKGSAGLPPPKVESISLPLRLLRLDMGQAGKEFDAIRQTGIVLLSIWMIPSR